MVPLAPVAVKGDKASTRATFSGARRTTTTAPPKRSTLTCARSSTTGRSTISCQRCRQRFRAPFSRSACFSKSAIRLREISQKRAVGAGQTWARFGRPQRWRGLRVPGLGSKGYSVGFDSQFPIFTDTASRIAGSRVSWWLRSVMGGSSSYACYVSGTAMPTTLPRRNG